MPTRQTQIYVAPGGRLHDNESGELGRIVDHELETARKSGNYTASLLARLSQAGAGDGSTVRDAKTGLRETTAGNAGTTGEGKGQQSPFEQVKQQLIAAGHTAEDAQAQVHDDVIKAFAKRYGVPVAELWAKYGPDEVRGQSIGTDGHKLQGVEIKKTPDGISQHDSPETKSLTEPASGVSISLSTSIGWSK